MKRWLFGCELKLKQLSHVQLFVTPWTVAPQAPQSIGFSRHEYWSGWPFPSLGDLPYPGIEPRSPVLQADTLPSELHVNAPQLRWHVGRYLKEMMGQFRWIRGISHSRQKQHQSKTQSQEHSRTEWKEIRWEKKADYIMQALQAMVEILDFVLSMTRSPWWVGIGRLSSNVMQSD